MRIDFYTHVHKKQRKMLFALAAKVGDANFSDSTVISEINHDLRLMVNELRQHAFHEETFLHPLLAKKIPQSEYELHKEHEMLKKQLNNLEENYSYLQVFLPHYEKLQAQGLEFYRMLNRFISTYFLHMNEEEYVMQNVWEIAMEAELTGMMIAFQTYSGTEKGEEWLQTHLPNMSLDEQQVMFKTTQLLAPEPIFITMSQLAEKMLGSEKWKMILEKMN